MTSALITRPEGLALPLRRPEVFDNSTVSTWTRCPRKGFYQYSACRSPVGINFPIQWGVGYHKFREVIESLYQKIVLENKEDVKDSDVQSIIFNAGWDSATKVTEGSWIDPEPEHRHSYLTRARLLRACEESFDAWLMEKSEAIYKVLLHEQPFDLELPSGHRYGGRFDQLVDWRGKLWVRDFKTTSRMGKGYALRFDPNNQMTGYVWGAQVLSGRPVEGVIIEVVYNTKTKGPDFFQFLSTRTPIQVRQWSEYIGYEISDIERHMEQGVFPMRTDACDDYGGCYFRDACKRDGWGSIQRWLEANTVESVWDFMDPDSEEGVVD